MKTKRKAGAPAPAAVRELARLRNGRCAGTHGRGNKPDRSNARRQAIAHDARC